MGYPSPFHNPLKDARRAFLCLNVIFFLCGISVNLPPLYDLFSVWHRGLLDQDCKTHCPHHYLQLLYNSITTTATLTRKQQWSCRKLHADTSQDCAGIDISSPRQMKLYTEIYSEIYLRLTKFMEPNISKFRGILTAEFHLQGLQPINGKI